MTGLHDHIRLLLIPTRLFMLPVTEGLLLLEAR